MGAVVERHEGVVGSVALRCTELTVIGRVYSAWCSVREVAYPPGPSLDRAGRGKDYEFRCMYKCSNCLHAELHASQ